MTSGFVLHRNTWYSREMRVRMREEQTADKDGTYKALFCINTTPTSRQAVDDGRKCHKFTCRIRPLQVLSGKLGGLCLSERDGEVED